MTLKETQNVLDKLIPNYGDYELAFIINDTLYTAVNNIMIIRNDDETVTFDTKEI